MRLPILGRWILFACVFGVISLCATREAAAQAGFVDGGFLYDIKRYSSGDVIQKVYDGNAAGGFVGAGAFVMKRLSVEFEAGFSRDTTTIVSTPVLVGSSTVDFNTTYTSSLQTYSALVGVHTAPSERLHLSFRGGVTFVHQRREIIPPQILPVYPQEPSTPPVPATYTDNVAGPTAGVDADVMVTPRLAIVGALRITQFRLNTDLSAFTIRPMVGARVTF